MRLRGHAETIVDVDKAASETSQPVETTRSQYVQHVNILLQRNRGRELPGTFNPLVIGEMFSAQCKPWDSLSKKYVDMVFCSVRGTLSAAAKHVADDETVVRLTVGLLNPSIADLEASVGKKLAELLEPHISGHPITYNHYLTENIQKAQHARHEARLKEAFRGHLDPTEAMFSSVEIVPIDLYSAVMKATEPNMENYASMTAIDTMEAYYKAYKTAYAYRTPTIFRDADMVNR